MIVNPKKDKAVIPEGTSITEGISCSRTRIVSQGRFCRFKSIAEAEAPSELWYALCCTLSPPEGSYHDTHTSPFSIHHFPATRKAFELPAPTGLDLETRKRLSLSPDSPRHVFGRQHTTKSGSYTTTSGYSSLSSGHRSLRRDDPSRFTSSFNLRLVAPDSIPGPQLACRLEGAVSFPCSIPSW